jgi:uncharacterized damage-inducible protein DinB
MEAPIQPLYELLKLNTKLFVNCLEGFDEETARTRINDRTNNVAFLTTHLVDARYFLSAYLGVTATNPFKEMLEGLTSIEGFTEFPLVQEVKTAWHEVSQLLAERFDSLTAADLSAESSQKFPIEDDRVLGGIAFLIQHEAYHLGQLGLLRRAFDLKAMSYD